MFFWATIERAAPFLITFAFSIVLARLLPPEVYGLLAMVGVLYAIGGAVQEMGFSAALVQRENLTTDDTTTAFITNTLLGGLVAAVLTISAPAIASFFGRPELIEIVYVYAAVLVIMSFGVVQSAMMQRDFKFRIGFIVDTVAALVGGLVGVALAVSGFGVWSLVAISLVRELSRTSLLWLLVGWRPRGRFSTAAIVGLWPYSRNILAASLYHHVASNLPSVIIGKFHSATTLGLFARAQSLQILPGALLLSAVPRVAFSLFSREQADSAALRLSLRAHIRTVALIAGFVTAGVMTNAQEIVLILVGPAWIASADMLRILSAAILLGCVFPLHSELNKASGESGYFLLVEVLKKTVQIAIIALGAWFGMTGLLWALVAVSVTDYVLSASASVKYVAYLWSEQAIDLLPPILTTAAAVVIALAVGAMLPEVPSLVGLVVKGGAVSAVFAFAVLTIGSNAFPEVSTALRTAIVPRLTRWRMG